MSEMFVVKFLINSRRRGGTGRNSMEDRESCTRCVRKVKEIVRGYCVGFFSPLHDSQVEMERSCYGEWNGV